MGRIMEKESVAIFTCIYLLHVEEEWDVHVPWNTTEVRDGQEPVFSFHQGCWESNVGLAASSH